MAHRFPPWPPSKAALLIEKKRDAEDEPYTGDDPARNEIFVPGGPVCAYRPPASWRHVSPIERAAHLYCCFCWDVAGLHCDREGIAEADRIAGIELADQRQQARRIDIAVNGDPAYGRRA